LEGAAHSGIASNSGFGNVGFHLGEALSTRSCNTHRRYEGIRTKKKKLAAPSWPLFLPSSEFNGLCPPTPPFQFMPVLLDESKPCCSDRGDPGLRSEFAWMKRHSLQPSSSGPGSGQARHWLNLTTHSPQRTTAMIAESGSKPWGWSALSAMMLGQLRCAAVVARGDPPGDSRVEDG
jgi:hypothetical protein